MLHALVNVYRHNDTLIRGHHGSQTSRTCDVIETITVRICHNSGGMLVNSLCISH